jgi:chaperonin GroES
VAILDAVPDEPVPEMDGVSALGEEVVEPSPIEKLLMLASKAGDFSEALGLEDLHRIGQDVCEDYDKDKADRRDWEEIAKEALKLASQEAKGEAKSYPWPGCANVKYPLLTTAALQFNARAYPAIVKGDEAISVKVVGQDRGRPMMGPDGQPAMGLNGQPVPPQMIAQMPPEMQSQLQPVWAVPPGGKASRAQRVAEYLNTVLFYRMVDWESDTDTLTIQLPIVGCAFRKVWFDSSCREQKAAFVSALRIHVPQGARSCDTTPRLTEEIPDVYPHEINEKMRSGFYRDITLTGSALEGDLEASLVAEDEKDKGRLLLEQHRLMDLDEDGLDEPYILTVDYETRRVLRIEANFAPEDVKQTEEEEPRVLSIARGKFYVKYDFFPHPEGKFYGLGLGHLLHQHGEVINALVNQIIDAGAAQAAGGGFIASGVRLQARGGGSMVRFSPGEYKTVDVPGDQLRNAIYERTLPNVSPITFQVLELILGAARDISGVKDVITGDASNMGQVGTTLALIEQGLQVFNAVYKRIYRALKEEFTLIYRNVAKYGGEEAARDYAEIMDDPSANFEADFNQKDMDIRPVSDPSSVTRMQKMARAQAILGTANIPGANPVAILKRVYEAMDVENPEELIMQPPSPPPPDPKVMAAAEKDMSVAGLNQAKTAQTAVETELSKARAHMDAFKVGADVGMADAA